MRRSAIVTRLVMLLSVFASSGLQGPVGASQAGANETTIRGAVVQIGQVVEVLAEDGTRHMPTQLPSGAVMSSDLTMTLIPSEANAEISPRGLILIPTGSGTVVSENGLILTNAHVVRHGLIQPKVKGWQTNVAQQGGGYQLRVNEDLYGILRLTEPQSPSAPPEHTYFAELAMDSSGEQIVGEGNRDIAVLKIKIDRYEDPFTTDEFQATYFVELGDSSRVPADTSIRIFGYPRGVQTLIRTRGDVTGREQDTDWTWIITDADVDRGNSGGAAVNEEGYLIGIPTEVNCRVTDEEADCPVTEEAAVKILPINAAKPLLARAGLELTPPATSEPTARPVTPTATATETSTVQAGALPAGAEPATVLKVTEGDALEVEVGGERQTVRLNLIDTPEIGFAGEPDQCFAREARDFTAALLPEGTTVWLERGATVEDQYGRLLRFVWAPGDDGEAVLVNELLVREGYAFILSVPEPEGAYEEQLRDAEEAAYAGHRGLWGACAGTPVG